MQPSAKTPGAPILPKVGIGVSLVVFDMANVLPFELWHYDPVTGQRASLGVRKDRPGEGQQ